MKLARWELDCAAVEMAAIFPGSKEDGLIGIEGMDVRAFIANVCVTVPPRAAFGLRVAIWLVAFAPLFVLGRFATILGVSQTDRERVVEVLAASNVYAIRQLTLILKTIGALLYAGNEQVRARMFGDGDATTAKKEQLIVLGRSA